MRRTLLFACGSLPLAAAVACASSERDASPPREDAGSSTLTDAGAKTPEDAPPGEVPPIPSCSDAGWCPTALPDPDLVLKDIWPLAESAFAIAESPTLGVRILEWEEAAAKWKYIDDNSQNQSGLGDYAGYIWAPSVDEVYFTVASATIEHGTRPVPPATTWSWERHRLDDHSPDLDAHPDHDHGAVQDPELGISYPSLGVWGIGADVYAWYANSIYRRVDGGDGVAAWALEHTAGDVDDPDEHISFVSAAGASADEVWFVAVRQRPVSETIVSCPLIVRKTSAGYERIFDGITGDGCSKRMGLPAIGGAPGAMIDLQALPGNRFAGLKGGHDVVILSQQETGSYSIAHAAVLLGLYDRPLYSVYSPSESVVWLSGRGIVVRGEDVWNGGAFGVSTISLNGGPIDRPMYRIRGTSNTNLWAVGVRHALHKTTP